MMQPITTKLSAEESGILMLNISYAAWMLLTRIDMYLGSERMIKFLRRISEKGKQPTEEDVREFIWKTTGVHCVYEEKKDRLII